jgi:hypothetical protein
MFCLGTEHTFFKFLGNYLNLLTSSLYLSLCSSKDGSIIKWDIETGKKLHTYKMAAAPEGGTKPNFNGKKKKKSNYGEVC